MANKTDNTGKKKFSIKDYFRGIKIEMKKVVLFVRWDSGLWIRAALLSFRSFSESSFPCRGSLQAYSREGKTGVSRFGFKLKGQNSIKT